MWHFRAVQKNAACAQYVILIVVSIFFSIIPIELLCSLCTIVVSILFRYPQEIVEWWTPGQVHADSPIRLAVHEMQTLLSWKPLVTDVNAGAMP